MSGLLDNVLPWIFSQGDTMKRNLRGNVRSLLEDPRGYAQSIGQDIAAENTRKSQAAKALLYPSVMDEQGQQQAMQAMTETALNLLAPTVYHGSPHKFDRFDSSKIGTGEGAQAYGHGLYLADLPEVAQTYQQTAPYVGRHVQQLGLDALNKSGGDITKARALLHEQYLANKDPYLRQPLADALNNITEIAKPSNGNLYKVDLPDSMVAKMLDWDKPLSQQPESVRKYFEPLISKTREELSRPAPGWGEFSSPQAFDPTGKELLALLRDNHLSPDTIFKNGLGPSASNSLRQSGIPGVRYLDAGSRALPETELARIAKLEEQARHYEGLIRNPPSYMRGNEDFAGWTKQRDAALAAIEKIKSGAERTHNYVVFPGEESALKILERNGKGLLDR